MKKQVGGHWKGVLACLLAGTVLLSHPQWVEAQSLNDSPTATSPAKPAYKTAKKYKKKPARSAKSKKVMETKAAEPEAKIPNAATPQNNSVIKAIVSDQVSQLAQLTPAAGFSDVMNWISGEEEIAPSKIPVNPNETMEASPTVSSFEEAPPAPAASAATTPAPAVVPPPAIPPVAPQPPALPPIAEAPAAPPVAPGAPLVVRDPVDAAAPVAPVDPTAEKQNPLFSGEVQVPEKKPEPVFLDLPSDVKKPEQKADVPPPAPAAMAEEEEKKKKKAKQQAEKPPEPPAPAREAPTTLALPPSTSMQALPPMAPDSEPKLLPPVNVTSEAPPPAAAAVTSPVAPLPNLPLVPAPSAPPPAESTVSAPTTLVPLPPINDPIPVPPPSLSQVPAAPVEATAAKEKNPDPSTLAPAPAVEMPSTPPAVSAPVPPPAAEPVQAAVPAAVPAQEQERDFGDRMLGFFSRNLGLEDEPKPAPAAPVALPVTPPAANTAPDVPASAPAPETATPMPAMPPVVDAQKAAPVAPVITSPQPFAAPENLKPAEAPAALPLPPAAPQSADAADAKKKQEASPESPKEQQNQVPESTELPKQAEKSPVANKPSAIFKRKKEKVKSLSEQGDSGKQMSLESTVPLVTALDSDQPLPLPENKPEGKPAKKGKKSTTPPPRLIEEVVPPRMGEAPRMLGDSTTTSSDEGNISQESRRILSKIPSGLAREKTPKSTKLKMDHSREIGDLFPDDDKEDRVHARGIDIKIKRQDADVDGNLGRAYDAVMAGRSEEATALYEEVLAYEPSNKAALLGLATTYHRSGQLKKARPLYGRLIELDPQNKEAISNFLGLLSEEDPQEALFQLEKLEDANPNFAPIPAQMSMINQKLGNLEDAKKQMIRASVLVPENMVYRYNLAVLLDRMDDWRGASKLYQQIISASERGEKIPAPRSEIQERLTFILSNIPK